MDLSNIQQTYIISTSIRIHNRGSCVSSTPNVHKTEVAQKETSMECLCCQRKTKNNQYFCSEACEFDWTKYRLRRITLEDCMQIMDNLSKLDTHKYIHKHSQKAKVATA